VNIYEKKVSSGVDGWAERGKEGGGKEDGEVEDFEVVLNRREGRESLG